MRHLYAPTVLLSTPWSFEIRCGLIFYGSAHVRVRIRVRVRVRVRTGTSPTLLAMPGAGKTKQNKTKHNPYRIVRVRAVQVRVRVRVPYWCVSSSSSVCARPRPRPRPRRDQPEYHNQPTVVLVWLVRAGYPRCFWSTLSKVQGYALYVVVVLCYEHAPSAGRVRCGTYVRTVARIFYTCKVRTYGTGGAARSSRHECSHGTHGTYRYVRRSTVRYGATRYGTVRHGTVRCDTVRHGATRYGTVLPSKCNRNTIRQQQLQPERDPTMSTAMATVTRRQHDGNCEERGPAIAVV